MSGAVVLAHHPIVEVLPVLVPTLLATLLVVALVVHDRRSGARAADGEEPELEVETGDPSRAGT
jgi:hypothetical protein